MQAQSFYHPPVLDNEEDEYLVRQHRTLLSSTGKRYIQARVIFRSHDKKEATDFVVETTKAMFPPE